MRNIIKKVSILSVYKDEIHEQNYVPGRVDPMAGWQRSTTSKRVHWEVPSKNFPPPVSLHNDEEFLLLLEGTLNETRFELLAISIHEVVAALLKKKHSKLIR